jgi:hypothetical protein
MGKLPDWGTAVGAIFNKLTEWIPSKRESKQNTIDRLVRENEQLQSKATVSIDDLMLIGRNADRIKQLRSEIQRID